MSNRNAGPLAIVTGGNRGIGFAISTKLAARGFRVLMLCRDESRAREACSDIKRNTRAAVDYLAVDLASQQSIRHAAEIIADEHSDLSILVHNAAAASSTRQLTADGIELQFAVNHLAPFLLTHLLFETLRVNAPARVVTVASRAHHFGRIHFDDVNLTTNYGAIRAYRQSKLANVLFTAEAERRRGGRGITFNCVHPGVVASGLLHTLSFLPRPLHGIQKLFMEPAERAAEGPVHLATSADLDTVSGAYFHRTREQRASRRGRDPEAARRLWDLSEQLTGLA